MSNAPDNCVKHCFGAVNRPGFEVLELPLPDLPDDLADAVAAVTFSEPPDFGPTSD